MEIFTDPWLGVTLANRYVILEQAGAGGWGTVYLAEQLALSRKVAVKILDAKLSRTENITRRFEQEAVTLSALQHPGIVSIIDFGMMPQPYIVMEWIPGSDLSESFAVGVRFSLEHQVEIFRQLADALLHAHTMHVTHRDLKPANIKVSFTPQKEPRAKILDFGLAKLRASEEAGFTRTGECIGSPSYMSPEQCMGRKLSASSDIYSLGCVMYEMLAGRPLFQKKTIEEYFAAHNAEQPAPIFSNPSVSEKALESIVLRCLLKVPEKRYADAAALLAELRALDAVHSGADVRPSTSISSPKRTAIIAGGVSAAALAAGIFFATQIGTISKATSGESSDPVAASVQLEKQPQTASDVLSPPEKRSPTEVQSAALTADTVGASRHLANPPPDGDKKTVEPSGARTSHTVVPIRSVDKAEKPPVENVPAAIAKRPPISQPKNVRTVASLPKPGEDAKQSDPVGPQVPTATDVEWIDSRRQRTIKLRFFRSVNLDPNCKRPLVLFSGDKLPTLDSWFVKAWLASGLFVMAYDPSNLPPMTKDNNFNANIVRDRERDLNFMMDQVAKLIDEQEPLVAQVGTAYILAGVRNSANSMMVMTGVKPNTTDFWKRERVANHVKGLIFISPGYCSYRPQDMGSQIRLPLCVISVTDDIGSTRWDKEANSTELFSSAPVKLKYELHLNTTLQDLTEGNVSKQKLDAASRLCNQFVRTTFNNPVAIETLRSPAMTSLLGPDDEYIYPGAEAESDER